MIVSIMKDIVLEFSKTLLDKWIQMHLWVMVECLIVIVVKVGIVASLASSPSWLLVNCAVFIVIIMVLVVLIISAE